MKFGYARVSTKEQNLELQRDLLNKYGVDQIFREEESTRSAERPELEKMLGYLRPEDTVVVWKLDRIGRGMRHLLNLMNGFEEKGIHFVSLVEDINTSTPTRTLIFHVFASIAEFEMDMIRERTLAGLTSARARGRIGGRSRKKQNKVELAITIYRSQHYTLKQIQDATGVSTTSLYRYLGEAKEKEEVEKK